MLDPNSIAGATISVALLLVVIAFTVASPVLAGRRLPAAVVAVPVAALTVALGLVDDDDAWAEVRFMGPTIAFLAGMLVVAEACRRSGVFIWVGAMVARWSRGSPHRLLGIIFVAASIITAVLSIDTTIVLLTPVAVATARRVGARVAPVGYASAHLANSASTLLPVSNLTNLLAFSATGLGFLQFTGLMAAPWAVSILVEYLVFRWFFADQLDARAPKPSDQEPPPPVPVGQLVTLVGILAGFVVAEPLGLPLYAVAWIGAAVMMLPTLVRTPLVAAVATIQASKVDFLAFVAALGVIILPVRLGPLGDAATALIPDGTGLLALIVMAAVATILANLLNNLPATLLLIPLVAGHPALALAALLGVNIGPNLAYFGSLANLLWREIMHRHTAPPTSRTHLLLGVLTVPPTLLAAVLALWVGVRFTSLAG